MSKYIKHNFNKDDSGENNETPRNKDPKIVSIDSLKEKYATEVALTIAPEILEFTKITADILEDEFDHDCTINRREVDGNYRLYVTKK